VINPCSFVFLPHSRLCDGLLGKTFSVHYLYVIIINCETALTDNTLLHLVTGDCLDHNIIDVSLSLLTSGRSIRIITIAINHDKHQD